jgi:hypothetical protein
MSILLLTEGGEIVAHQVGGDVSGEDEIVFCRMIDPAEHYFILTVRSVSM